MYIKIKFDINLEKDKFDIQECELS